MTDDDELTQNRELVARFFRLVPFGPGNNLHILDDLLSDDYLQHNPFAEQGREGVRRFFTEFMPLPFVKMNGGESMQVNVLAEGDLVVRHDVRARGMLIDIFRVRDGQLAEHWDAYRPAIGAERIKGF